MNILMVCLGNICRSPIADGLLRQKVKMEGLAVEVDSAGTSDHHAGESPDARMRATAKQSGCPIDDLRSRPFVVEDFDRFDKIFVMDRSNRTNVLRLARTESDRNKVELILNILDPGTDAEVPDPYYGGEQGFIDVYKMLDRATNRIMQKIKENEW